jgi:DMSO/TMAO reductase YedYZ molybdopterin-dependent catalytic subunit
MKRKLFLASSLVALTGCDNVWDSLNASPFHNALLWGEHLNEAVIGTRGRVKTYADRDVDTVFRTNGFDTPTDSAYTRLVADGFSSYKLVVDGLVDRKQAFSLAELRALAHITEATRHDCVEGWSAIGKWGGPQLSTVLALAQPTSAARYAIFHCMDVSSDGDPYYESLDLHQAAHPQTVLALDLNGKPLDKDHGAPVRLRIPTQLGYKSAKWVNRIELASTLDHAYHGGGGYWEDQGYEWYAGI